MFVSGGLALTRTFESTLCFICLLALAGGWEINGEGESESESEGEGEGGGEGT